MGGISTDRERAAMAVIEETLADPNMGPGNFTDEEWHTATSRVRATREEVLADPRAAELENRKYGDLARRARTLGAIRKARGFTQKQLSAQLDISQAEVSRIEHQNNLHLTTLTRFIEATGGKLRITAVFDDEEVEVGVGDLLSSERRRSF